MSDLDDLKALARRIPLARKRMLENLPGYGTGGDGPTSGHGDRTLSLALKQTMATDPAVRDLQRLAELERDLKGRVETGRGFHRELGQLKIIVDRWAPTDRMTDGLRTAGDDTGEGWCKSHWRVGSCHPPRTQGSKLCRWCEDMARELGMEMPPQMLVQMRAEGKRITDRDVRIALLAKGKL